MTDDPATPQTDAPQDKPAKRRRDSNGAESEEDALKRIRKEKHLTKREAILVFEHKNLENNRHLLREESNKSRSKLVDAICAVNAIRGVNNQNTDHMSPAELLDLCDTGALFRMHEDFDMKHKRAHKASLAWASSLSLLSSMGLDSNGDVLSDEEDEEDEE